MMKKTFQDVWYIKCVFMVAVRMGRSSLETGIKLFSCFWRIVADFRVSSCFFNMFILLVVSNFFIFHILGMSSSQLTFIFFRGIGQPPTSHSWGSEFLGSPGGAPYGARHGFSGVSPGAPVTSLVKGPRARGKWSVTYRTYQVKNNSTISSFVSKSHSSKRKIQLYATKQFFQKSN